MAQTMGQSTMDIIVNDHFQPKMEMTKKSNGEKQHGNKGRWFGQPLRQTGRINVP